MSLNLQHPIFGTGVETPLGKSDPSKAATAAKYIRQAMSHVIPRERIVDEIMKNSVSQGVVPIPRTIIGYDKTLEPYAYDISKAKLLMEKAGYVKIEEPDGGVEGNGGSNDSPLRFDVITTVLISVTLLLFRSKRANKVKNSY